ncbi:MAG TPA: tetratricopeptide repeat protein [Rhizomicrobium sp.]|jgi:tetratricopeptide (TPR) repeat protein
MLRKTGIIFSGAAAAAVLLSAAAWANAVDDGNAGVEALNNGNYDQAVKLFTHALKSGELKGDDKEFAYYNRGKAYLGEHEYKLAIADLKAALKLKPDDGDAQSALQDAQSEMASASPSAAASSSSRNAGAGEPSAGLGWGFLGDLADRYFWYQLPGKDPHLAMVHYTWSSPQQVLNYQIRNKSRAIAAGEYRLDPATGKVLEAEAVPGGTIWGTVSASPYAVTEFFFMNGKPSRVIESRAPDGSYVEKSQTYVGGNWQDATSVTLVEASQAEAQSGGFFKAKK